MAIGSGSGRAPGAEDPENALARMLLRRGLVQPVQIDLARSRADGLPLAARLLAIGAIDDAVLATALAEHHGLPLLSRPELLDAVAPVATAVPLEARTAAGARVARVVVQPGPDDLATSGVGIALLRDLQACAGSASQGAIGEPLGVQDGRPDDTALRALASVLRRARREGVDAVLIEPAGDRVRLRLRTGNALADALDLPVAIEPALAAALKRMAGLDAVERTAPQDALVRLRLADPEEEQSIAHVATTPSTGSERLVVRLVG